jgi:hypothetical protein
MSAAAQNPSMDELLAVATIVIAELMAEFLRRGDEEYGRDCKSQLTACFMLAIRSASLLNGMRNLLTPSTLDCFEVSARGFLETRDLLLTFRFNEKGTRNKIGYWFQGGFGSAWKAEHKKCEDLMTRIGYTAEFGKKWSQTTALAHPTFHAASNSVVASANRYRPADMNKAMRVKTADYLASIASLIVIATIDFPGLIRLGCDLKHLPNIDTFRANVMTVAAAVLKVDTDLPPGSYRA